MGEEIGSRVEENRRAKSYSVDSVVGIPVQEMVVKASESKL